LTVDLIRALTPCTDFFGIGPEIWSAEDPLTALQTLRAAMS
ncbi:MAG: thiamine phosphate synthase, partial [Pseudomonadota bacterium]